MGEVKVNVPEQKKCPQCGWPLTKTPNYGKKKSIGMKNSSTARKINLKWSCSSSKCQYVEESK